MKKQRKVKNINVIGYYFFNQLQVKGYGRAATEELILRLKELEDCNNILVSYRQDNENAAKLYASLGFEKTGEIMDGEVVAKLEEQGG